MPTRTEHEHCLGANTSRGIHQQELAPDTAHTRFLQVALRRSKHCSVVVTENSSYERIVLNCIPVFDKWVRYY